jgi:hypothetical protein
MAPKVTVLKANTIRNSLPKFEMLKHAPMFR